MDRRFSCVGSVRDKCSAILHGKKTALQDVALPSSLQCSCGKGAWASCVYPPVNYLVDANLQHRRPSSYLSDAFDGSRQARAYTDAVCRRVRKAGQVRPTKLSPLHSPPFQRSLCCSGKSGRLWSGGGGGWRTCPAFLNLQQIIRFLVYRGTARSTE